MRLQMHSFDDPNRDCSKREEKLACHRERRREQRQKKLAKRIHNMPTVGIDEERQPIRELHEYIFMPLIGILGLLLQLKHAAESASPFVTEHVTMLTFIVVFIVYFGLVTVKLFSRRPTRNSNMAKFMTNITLLSGSLASILLLKILVPAYGWLALFFWMIYLIRDVVTKKSYWRALVHVFGKVRVLICGSSAGESNVVQPPPVPEVVVPIQDARQRSMEEPNEPRPTPLPDAVSQPAGLPV